jgi:Uma2 family endonuclease
MSEQAGIPVNLTADDFLTTDQRIFGDAWRYEMMDGRIIAHAAPSPDHGAILVALSASLFNRLRTRTDCRGEAGSGAVPKRQQRNTARIPDAMIRCGQLPKVLFEIVSPSDLEHRKAWDRRRRDLQDVEGVEEIVELFQDGTAHIYRKQKGIWAFEFVDDLTATLRLPSVGLEIPLEEIYASVDIPPDEDENLTG